ncbi:pyridoxal phosphate-dependent aminotransferase [SAR202 cluster bacterium AC-409-J13_OGT_754m]|nr:pyridoxal phosphate-dependent aminotransferase [SAR202 cluster bacterium AC-409-J13_OGT_754m]
MAISNRSQLAIKQGGWIRKMFEVAIELKQRFGDDNVFDLSLGNPIVEPPQEFTGEVAKLINSPPHGYHRYMPNAGYESTRDAIAQILTQESGLGFSHDEILMTCGAAGALNVVFESILNPQDEVIILAPYFGEFTFYIENHQGIPVVSQTNESFQPDLESLADLIGPKTRAILINSPNNPSGVLYPKSTLSQIGALISKKESELGSEIFLISDEPYRRIVFDDLIYPHVFEHHHASIAIHSHSKDLAIPGERIGYIALNPKYGHKSQLMEALIFWNRSLGFVNAPAIMQNTIRALQGVSVNIQQYQDKRDLLYSELTSMGYQVTRPQGAFYMFPKSPIENDIEFVNLLQEYNVLTVPGHGFGRPGYFRISYCVDDRVLNGSLEGFQKVASEFI